MFINGHTFSALIDTGADLSLIFERFLDLFKNKVSSCNVLLKGITNMTISDSKMFVGQTKISDVDTMIS